MRQSRPIVAIEPIETQTVFVADSQGRFDRERARSSLIMDISAWLQIDAPREFSLNRVQEARGMAQSRLDILGSNVRTHFPTSCFV
jgi:hypothetical protein